MKTALDIREAASDTYGGLRAMTALLRWEAAVAGGPLALTRKWRAGVANAFDELDALADRDPEAAAAFAQRMARVLVGETDKNQPYWDEAAATFLTGAILYVVAREPQGWRHAPRLRALLLEGDALLAKMATAREGAFGDVIAGTAALLLGMESRQRQGVVSTARERTWFLD